MRLRWPVRLAIASYRRLVKPWYRRECLFRQSCSAHVLAEGERGGLRAALHALEFRIKACRPGYSPCVQGGQAGVVTCGGVFVPAAALTRNLQREVDDAMAEAGRQRFKATTA